MNFVRIAVNAGISGWAATIGSTYVISGSHSSIPEGTGLKELDDEVLRRDVMQVAADMQLENLDRLTLTTHKGYYPITHGCLGLPGGAYLSLPEFYSRNHMYESRTGTRFDVEEQIYRALRPGDAVRNFCTAHELSHLRRGDSLKREALFFLAGGLVVNWRASTRLRMSSIHSALMTTAWIASAYIAGSICTIFYDKHAEFRADRAAAEIGPGYAEGGIQMCDKFLMAHKLIYEHYKYGWLSVAPDGERYFSLGKPLYSHRQHRIRKIATAFADEAMADRFNINAADEGHES